jgi:MFS family permease
VGGIVGPSIAGAFVGAGWMARDIFYVAAIPALISALTMLFLRRVLQQKQHPRASERVAAKTV